MKIVTKQQHIKGVAKAWYNRYKLPTYYKSIQAPEWEEREGEEGRGEVYNKLKALENPTVEQIDEIIGDSRWTRLECSECRLDSPALVYLGGFHMCGACLRKMADEYDQHVLASEGGTV